jgi:hypothetical protein
MNATRIHPGPDDREQLARLVPAPAQRDLPSHRQRQLKEFVMAHIQQNQPATQPVPRTKRRLVLAGSVVTAAAVAAVVAVVVTIGGGVGTGGPTGVPTAGAGATTPAGVQLSGQGILLAAATVAAQTPPISGTYWYQKVVSEGPGRPPFQFEYWNDREGRLWFRGEKSHNAVIQLSGPSSFHLSALAVSFEQIQNLPTEPAALTAWLTDAIEHSDARTSAGPLNSEQRKHALFTALVSLVSQSPAPPNVRAAAFQAIAASANVESLGEVPGGVGLRISSTDGRPAELVIDPTTAQIRQANWFVMADGAEYLSGEGGKLTLVCEWTNALPQ